VSYIALIPVAEPWTVKNLVGAAVLVLLVVSVVYLVVKR
jgi:hypothetical protein